MHNESGAVTKTPSPPRRFQVEVDLKSDKPNESPKGLSLDSILKITSSLIAAAGFVFGIVTFQTQQKNIQTESFKMKLWERKLSTYNELADIAGNIVIFRSDSLALDSLVDKFDKVYYSSLILVQDDSVEVKVRAYKEALADYRQGYKSILYLKKSQIYLMQAISNSLKKTQDFGDEK